MKCPVCGTKVENTHICPNCGMTLKKDVIVEEVKQTTLEKPEYFGKNVSNGKKISRVIRLLIIIAALAGFIVFALVPLFKEATDGYSYQKIANMTFQEVIDEGYDTKDTVKNLMAYKEDFIDYLNNQGYEISHIVDSCYQERSTKPLIATSNIGITVGEYLYTDVSFTFQEGKLYSTKLSFNGHGNQKKKFDVIEIQVSSVSDKLNMNDAYDQLKYAYENIKEVEEGKYVFDDELNGYHVYVEVENSYISNIYYGYDASYSIEKVWMK